MSDIKNFERNKYFYGKLMTVRDFETEQSYFIEKQRLINRLIHGAGVVCGLEVEKAVDTTTKIKIKPGVAIDCCGREIIVPEEKVVDLKEEYSLGGINKVYVLLKYDFCEKESVPVINNVSACEETCCYNRILETYKIEISEDMPDDCVPSDGGLCDVWPAAENPQEFVDYWIKECPECPQEPAVLLAAISLQNSNIGEIDNAIKDGEEFDKSLVFSNPRLYELIKCVEKKAGLEKDLTRITGISWVHDKEYNVFNVTEREEFLNNLENLTITFERTINTRTINQKTLNVTAIAYSFGNIGNYRDVELPVKKIDLPPHFIQVINRDRVRFTVIPPGSIENLREALADFTIGEAVSAGYSAKTKQLNATDKRNTGLRILIQLKGDFVLDDDDNPVDVNHLKGKVRTGNGTPGGLFESWFDLKIDYSKLDKVIKEIRKHPSISGETLAENTETSEKTMELLLPALINNNVIYSENGLFYPLPNPGRTIVAYDGNYEYLRYSAERLKAGLRENGISAKITSLDKLTADDRKNHEIILVRGKTIISRDIRDGMPNLISRLGWADSTGATEIVANPYIADTNVFIVGGKNRRAVDVAVDGFLKNYTAP